MLFKGTTTYTYINMSSDIFIITSVINTGKKPWSYSTSRSCFTIEERFNQTLKSIESIRKFNNKSIILLVECSELDTNMTEILRQNVDFFLQTYDDLDVREACLNSEKKGWGEIKKLQKACNFINENNIKFNRLFKLSGRYFLNDNFNEINYQEKDFFTFKMYDSNNGSTVLYSVPFDLFEKYKVFLDKCDRYYQTNPPTGIETLIPVICTPRKEILILGVSGQVAVLNDKGESEFYTA